MQIAQINIAKMKGRKDSPEMVAFVDNLDRINSLADGSDGFVWRLIEESGTEQPVNVFDDDFLLINMSVWQSLDSLFKFTYQSMHVEIFKRKQEWFNKMEKMHMVIWYIDNGAIPSVEEGKLRLEYIQDNGPTPYAFNFKKKFNEKELM